MNYPYSPGYLQSLHKYVRAREVKGVSRSLSVPSDYVLSLSDTIALKRLRDETEDNSWRMERLVNGLCVLGQYSGGRFAVWKIFRGELDTPIIAWAKANHWKHIRAVQSMIERREKECELEKEKTFSDSASDAAGLAWDSEHRTIFT